jgi:hypothetical protein
MTKFTVHLTNGKTGEGERHTIEAGSADQARKIVVSQYQKQGTAIFVKKVKKAA